MGADATLMFSQVAIPAEHLERRVVGEPLFPQFAVELIAATSGNRLPMLAASAVDMIDGEKPDVGFSAASAFAAVGIDDLLPGVRALLLVALLIFSPARFTVDMRIIRRKRSPAAETHSRLASFGSTASKCLSLSLAARLTVNRREIAWAGAT